MKDVYTYMKNHGMVSRGDCVIAGVSGGADSVCMLKILKDMEKEMELTIHVVHVNHGVRGAESQEDSEYVKRMCRQWEIPFHLFAWDVPGIARERKCSVEEAGRELRYEAFYEAAEKYGGSRIAVAHNADDQAETILWNLVRGTGLKGLGGIRPVNGMIIRPLLCVTRKEILEYLKTQGIEYCTDSTNGTLDYTRNRLRLQILPLLEETVNGEARAHIRGLGERAAKAQEYLETQAAAMTEDICHFYGTKVLIETEGFLAQEEILQEYILAHCLEWLKAGRRDVDAGHFSQLKRLAKTATGKHLDLPGGLKAVREPLGLKLYLYQPEVPMEDTQVPVPGTVKCGKWTITTSLEPYRDGRIPEKKYTKWFDYDTINHILKFRTGQTGDYLVINSQGQRKQLNRYYIDSKVPREMRAGLPVLADGSRILWAPGGRISEDSKVTAAATTLLKVHIEEEADTDGR